MVKGGHHRTKAFSKQHFLQDGHRTSEHFHPSLFPAPDPACATTFDETHTVTSSSLRITHVFRICTSAEKHSCHRYMPFCQCPLFANFLALHVPFKYLLYLLCARVNKKSVNMCSYPGIFP
uniref:Uncharacterized protein n=1 Tax=Arundo donax TaxID=35708 RepID=A0A0A9GQH1_ARUDO